MKRTLVTTFLLILFFTMISVAQNTNLEYANLIRDGWKLCLEKEYTGSANLYEKAFNK